MLELSCCGAQVLHPRASSITGRFNIPVEIRNSFNNKSGTLITYLEGIESPGPKAITHSEDLYLVTLVQVPKRPHYLSQIVTELANSGIHLKFFFHGVADGQQFDLSFITPLDEIDSVSAILCKMMKKFRGTRIREFKDICSLSVIGRGIGSENKTLAAIFNTLSQKRLHIEVVTTSELSVNIFLKKRYLYKAINALLTKFHLQKR